RTGRNADSPIGRGTSRHTLKSHHNHTEKAPPRVYQQARCATSVYSPVHKSTQPHVTTHSTCPDPEEARSCTTHHRPPGPARDSATHNNKTGDEQPHGCWQWPRCPSRH